jgi:hypothetical protein
VCSASKWLSNDVTGPCECDRVEDGFKVHGHLLTVQPGWSVAFPALRTAVELLSRNGLSHVPVRPYDLYGLCVAYEPIIDVLQPVLRISREQLSSALFHYCAQTYSRAVLPHADVQHNDELRRSCLVLKRLVFVSASDKCKSQPVYACKLATVRRVREYMHQPDVYRQVQDPSLHRMISDVQRLLPSVAFIQPPICAVIYPLFKPHKGNFRFITLPPVLVLALLSLHSWCWRCCSLCMRCFRMP